MIHTVENEAFSVSVTDFGAELVSVKRKADGHEYLWQGDPAVWSGRAPILFPIVGRLRGDEYRLNGRAYTLPKHGFARKSQWSLLEKGDTHVSLLLRESPETLRAYPYVFRLIVTYRLEGNALIAEHDVVNENDGVMYFSLGAHPAFNCRIGDELEFEKVETLCAEKIDPETALLLPRRFPLLNGERTLTVTAEIFREDALILHGLNSRFVTLRAGGGAYTVRFDTGGAPYLGLWAKPGAPYVCIEPWWGVNDGPEPKNDLSEKTAIEALPRGERFKACWAACFS